MPQRRCAGCGRTRGKIDLVRFAQELGGDVVLDVAGRMQGRGAYVCAAAPAAPAAPAADCLRLALRRGGISRALRCSAKIDCTNLLESVSL